MGFMANPFDKLPFTPLDGEGINPLLTHAGMFFHPPALMAGLIATSIPFAFAMGSLIGGKTGDEWVDAGRSWGIVSWALLAGGLLLGSWWAYTILGWGGFWFWDPVENAAFMPWLALTAFVHSIMVQKRRGMFRMWNIALINVAFGLALYGMFMNRGWGGALGPFLRRIHAGMDIPCVPGRGRDCTLRNLLLAVPTAQERPVPRLNALPGSSLSGQ